ncbi:urea transporter [Rhodococcus sp. X156]|uniref:urea transporter n=1 Tax=Rhodococcus sp. X156 TaxID=2499145 RepID=UPI001F49A23E|nr:urea transporter [Rhodococcus sp. X156]
MTDMLSSTWNSWSKAYPAVGFLDWNLKGAGQVMFQGNALTGLFFLAGIFWGAIAADTVSVAVGAVVGLVVSTVTGLLLNSDDDSMDQGLYGYNGILVGAAFPTFLAGGWLLWVYLVVGSAVSTVVFMAISAQFKSWGVSALTFPFNLVNWVFLLAAFNFLRIETSGLASNRLPTPVAEADTSIDWSFQFLWDTLFRNIAQIFLIDNTVTGVLFVLGLLCSSAWAAGYALIGSVTAMIAVLSLGADTSDVAKGLYGFSAVLTGIALGCTFYRPGLKSFAYTIFGILFTVVIHGTLTSGLQPVGLPAGTAPFVFATWLFLLPQKKFAPVPHNKPIVHGALSPDSPGSSGSPGAQAH